MRKLAVTLLLLGCVLFSHAQKSIISGKITDSTEKRSLHLAAISLLRKSDSTLVSFTRTDKEGKFIIPQADTGRYVILVTYPRFADFMEDLEVKADKDMGDVFMTPASKLLNEVIVKTVGAIRIKGDTTEFVADSFKVKEGATVEDLLKKLPGFSVNSKGEIVAQGKRVDKVLVDGEEFFGDDPTMATQNISAKAVDKVQVFETKTEQQNMTGMTTGNEGKTVNIKLKEDAKKGAFGKIQAGSDLHKYFEGKALYNKFVGKKKISVYGTKTNVNTGSLNWEDRQKLGMENDFEYDELSGYYFSFGGNDEFNDWSLRGLPNAWTGGALFSNKWNADKHNVNVSYRYNQLATTNIGTTFTQNILPNGVSYSNKYTTKNGLNRQHAINGKYEWKLDSFATFKIVTAYTKKIGSNDGTNNGEFIAEDLDTVNQSFNSYSNNTDRSQVDNQLTWKQLFKKKNRQLNTVLRYGVTEDDNSGLVYTRIRFFDPSGIYQSSDTVDQQKLFDGRSTTLGIKTTFMEPLSVKWMLVMDYAWNKNHSRSLRNTYEKDFNGKYQDRVTDFSNNFELDAFSHSGSAIFRYTGKKMRAGIGSGFSAIKLGLHDLDSNSTNKFNFFNVTPQAQVNFTPKAQFNIGINYRGNTIQPNINQLQPLRDNTDELNVYTGNPDLKVGFNHSMSVFVNQYKVLSQSWLGANFSYNIQQNAITQFNTIDLNTGKRTYYPVNVSGNRNWYMWSSYNKSKGNKKPNYGFSINGNGNRFNNFVNGVKGLTRSFSLSFELQLGIESEEKFDFSIRPRIGYNKSNSSFSKTNNNNYWSYGGWAEAEMTLPWKMEFNSSLNADLRQKLPAFATNTNLIIWNAGLSKKIFKKDAGKIGIYVNDILDDNKGFTRNISSTFISDDRYQKISRYFLLKFEWSFNKAPGGTTK
ncbi:MAG TPA: TonB-dependent receptor [Chitinophagaceae bacterium]|nr:TonB-dependent receptor [Chitinophagaceae bacterium]